MYTYLKIYICITTEFCTQLIHKLQLNCLTFAILVLDFKLMHAHIEHLKYLLLFLIQSYAIYLKPFSTDKTHHNQSQSFIQFIVT